MPESGKIGVLPVPTNPKGCGRALPPADCLRRRHVTILRTVAEGPRYRGRTCTAGALTASTLRPKEASTVSRAWNVVAHEYQGCDISPSSQ